MVNPNRVVMGVSKGVSRGFKGVSLLMGLCVCIKYLQLGDPCMGSGHILVYAFDVLMQIYTVAGWSERDAAKSIIENNLYGLDIDDRAGQLAYFAIMMKARKYNRRVLNGETCPNVLSIQDSNWMTDEFIEYVAGKDKTMKADLVMLRKTFRDAKEYGSVLTVPQMQYDAVYARIEAIRNSAVENLFQIQYQQQATEQLLPLIRQSQFLSLKYYVAITNPPYMGSSGMSDRLSQFVKSNFPDSKSDLFAVFMERIIDMLHSGAYQAMITQHAWMFLTSFEKLRMQLLHFDIINMAHLGPRAFEEIGGEVVQTTAFVLRKSKTKNYRSTFFRLIDGDSQSSKERMLLEKRNMHFASVDDFRGISGVPFAYWLGQKAMLSFKGKHISDWGTAQEGIKTGDNDRFLRFWFEVDINRTNIHSDNNKKWISTAKAGEHRRWYGSHYIVTNFADEGKEIIASGHGSITGKQNFYKHAISWNRIATDKLAFRFIPENFISNMGGLCLYPKDDNLFFYLLAYLNSKVAEMQLNVINPTMSFPPGTINALGCIDCPSKVSIVTSLARNCVHVARENWDAQELSWDFQFHPLAAPAIQQYYMRLTDCWSEWEQACDKRFSQLKNNEEELNRIFIKIYDLQDVLVSNVIDKDVTVWKADLGRDIRSLISYAVGCMLGRYSLDKPGLAFAGGSRDKSQYTSYIPDHDGILPITDDEYFDDDIVGMFVNWVRTVYGKETLEENLKFIANALGGKGTPREVIRNYFLNDFYADHLKIYQKRPIYWLFSSGKKNGFKCLIYMHRYQPDLLARIRTDYVHEQQERYRTQLQMAEDSLQTAAPTERVKLNKRITKLKDQALELQKYEEKIHHLADQMIPIDLDDGVKVNYAKFEDVLEKIK